MQRPAKQTRAAAQFHTLECINHICCPVVLRRDGRLKRHTLTKNFLASMHYQFFLPMGLRARAFGARNSAINYYGFAIVT